MHSFVDLFDIIQICSGITSGRVLNWVLYAQRLQKIADNLSSVIFIDLFHN